MAYSLTVNVQQNWLLVAAEGEIRDFDDLSEEAQVMVENVLSTGVKRVFLDERRLVLSIDAHDITMLADKLGELNLQSMGVRLAYLCPPDCSDIYQTVETICQNRSLNVRVFEDRDEALAWLLA